MSASLPKPTIYAHRGSSAYAPENTIASFELAIQHQANAIELDAKLSADGRVVVIHDQTVDRTTDGSGSVSELTLRELKMLDAGCKYDTAFCGERIPTLADVFEAVGQKIFVNVELTNYASVRDDLPEKTAQLVKDFQMEGRVLFSSFNPIALRRIHKLLPEEPLGLLALPGFAGAWTRSFLGQWIVPYQALHPEVRDTHPKLITRQHKNNCKVNTYTVNNPEDMAKLFAWGIDGIFTDDPPLALRVFARLTNENKT